MTAQYRCGSERRRRLVRASTTLNGIEHLVVEPDQATVRVHFLHDLPGTGSGAVPPLPAPELAVANVAIDGGVRYPDVRAVAVESDGDVLTVTLDRAGDFSEYVLRLRSSAADPHPPDGFDPQLSMVRFTFKVDCPSGFDCRDESICPPEPAPEPALDYMAKDYASFRRLMLDRMSAVMPDWRERNPADVQIALVELLAYVGDHLSYYQDAVATEAYLGTARERISVRRHARLLDYRMHDGCNARTWIHLKAADGIDVELEAGRVILSGASGRSERIVPTASLDEVLARDAPVVFETQGSVRVRTAHNRIRLHTWSDVGCCLPAGATRATFVNDEGLALEVGDLLLFEEEAGPSGLPADADPGHRQVVRLLRVDSTRDANGSPVPLTDVLDGTPIVEVEWDAADALTFPLCISAVADDGTTVLEDLSVARGNVVLADHGHTRPLRLRPPIAPAGRPYRPVVDGGPLTCTGEPSFGGPASQALVQDPRLALPVVQLTAEGSEWNAQPDLLSSDRFEPEFVAEIDASGIAHLRFGDGALGRAPSEGAEFVATGRVGNGSRGNVGRETLTRLVADDGSVEEVRNPLPALGGTDPELTERVRLLAPHAFRRQERAVTESDYASIATRSPEVGHAAARIRWTGSWYTAVVTVDRPGGREVDQPFREALLARLDLHRMAGVDLDLGRPLDVPLELELEVCAKDDYVASDVKRDVLDALSSRASRTGAHGFFHPDNWTFGQPVYLSQLYRVVLGVNGIAWVQARRFQRLGRGASGELENGVLRTSALEIIRLDNDPNFQERGRLAIQMRGGR